MPVPEVPGEVRLWAEALRGLCRRHVPDAHGLYLTGSICTGGFNQTVSDLDLLMAVRSPVAEDVLRVLVAVLVELGPPPAAGGLDLEVFTLAGLRQPDTDLRWYGWIRWYGGQEPHLQTAGALPLSDWAPALAIARRHATPLFGPPSAELIGRVPRHLLLTACREELAGWGANYEEHWSLSGGILTACRAWWYWAESGLGSKMDAGRWALSRVGDPTLILQALDHQTTGAPHNLTPTATIAFVRHVAARIAQPPLTG